MSKVLKNQGYHLVAYILLGGLLYLVVRYLPESHNRVWGLSACWWLAISWIFAGAHQFYIVFNWRLELHHKKISAWFGKAAFPIYRTVFYILGSTRMLLLIPVSIATYGTLPIPYEVSIALIIVTTPFILWACYSTVFYFGLNRLVGADHFDPKYRGGTLEKRGIFKYIPNSMYTVALLMIYHPGLICHSTLGLIGAAVQHAFVWTHYFCTEKPDMQVIYGAKGEKP
jgi:hypothetical protein